MHLYFATKGQKNFVDQFITELQGKYLPFKWREKEGDQWKDIHLQIGVRPIQLWEVGFPKEHYDIVANTILGGVTETGIMGNDGKKPVVHKWINKFVIMIRKLLHLDPVLPYKTDMILPLNKQHMVVIPIGTKQDYIMPNGVEGI